MSALSSIVRALVDCGATPLMILAAVEAHEASAASEIDQRRSKDAARQQRRRDKKVTLGHVTSRDVTVTPRDGSFLSPSPTPPSTNLSPVTPYSPPPAKAPTVTLPPLAEQLWSLASKTARDRSGRPAVRKAVTAALGKGATPDALTASVKTHCRDAGEHAKGLHRLIEGEHWREHLPSLEPPAKPATEAERAHRLAHYEATREWKPSWGERPRDAA